jgi:adenine deaminase
MKSAAGDRIPAWRVALTADRFYITHNTQHQFSSLQGGITPMDHITLRRLLQTAKGELAPDTIITGGRIVNVFTNSIDENISILIKDGYIASFENGKGGFSGKAPNVIDAEGLYLCPGFIDSHTHLDSMLPFHELVPYAVRGGTTTVISECAAVAQSCGASALQTFIESTKGYPLRCYFVVAPLTPTFPRLERAMGISFREFARVLKRDDVLGIGEAYWTRLVEGDDRVLKQAALAISMGKTLEGHASGGRGNKLLQYMTTGVTSCHESVSYEEAMEKLKYGLYVMLRQGWVRKELDALSKLKDAPVDTRRLILASDVFDPVMLYEEGYMDVIVRDAISRGFSPMEALKMATINPADYFRLRHLGAIAPLRYADILFIDDLKKVSIQKVMVNGEMIYADRAFLPKLKPYRYPAAVKRTISAGKVREEDFRIKAHAPKHRVRVIEIANETITKESISELQAGSGYLEKDLSQDILPVAVMHRHDNKKMGKGFIRGTRIKEGAVAISVIWDTCNILVLGSSEKDMALAVNRLIDLQGGIVIVKNGKSIYEFPMPVYGTIPPYGMKEITGKIKALSEGLSAIGGNFNKPFLSLQTIPFTGLPFLQITDRRLAETKSRKLVSIFADQTVSG